MRVNVASFLERAVLRLFEVWSCDRFQVARQGKVQQCGHYFGVQYHHFHIFLQHQSDHLSEL
jgi:hypothetical protein